MFSGSLVAIVTPFKDKGEVDVKALADLIEFQIANGTDGIVPCGTTGESATLSHEEHERVIELTVEIVRGRVPVIAGTGSNSTAEALRLTKRAKASKADGALLITPYYNKPTQEGLYQHYKAIATEVDIPIIMYNVPGRTGVNMLPQTVARLTEFKNIVSIKEASGNLAQITEISLLCGDRMGILSGDDFTVLPTLAVGGKGVISVVANIAPADMANLIDEFAAGNYKAAADIQKKMLPLCTAMFIETNPIPVKTALALMGRIQQGMRLPLCNMSDANLAKLKTALKEYGLI